MPDNRASNCSIIEKNPPKGVIRSDFICTLAMSDEDLLAFICNTKLSESSDMTKYWVIHYYSVFYFCDFKSVAESRFTQSHTQFNLIR